MLDHSTKVIPAVYDHYEVSKKSVDWRYMLDPEIHKIKVLTADI